MLKSSSLYRSIALDIAQRIINGDFAKGAKLSGRTLLASQYNVSPETIRKAIGLLNTEGVVSVSQGKEITVVSVEKAYAFIEHYKSSESVYSLRQEIELLLKQKQELDARFEAMLTDIINYSDRLRNLTPYNPIEIEVETTAHVVGKTISELQMWQRTGATVVAIRRGTEVMISPGPLARLAIGDRIVLVGDSEVLQRMEKYLKMPKETPE
ncbi:GntR family transcriptional regulator [Anaerosporomusa subterranea]|uniref:GntR family transcriptional regulator n=1 Tax=Anaerosporomusa subterranea TaxID=1794912 RepID=A0A154BM07_ANASB|nr:TrkA C-terminal domain-containing protein [Anaerosporomusa subterranea]KYZ75013.1 GntR family transcriptional regulator [Anaerosporomusa subterranea]